MAPQTGLFYGSLHFFLIGQDLLSLAQIALQGLGYCPIRLLQGSVLSPLLFLLYTAEFVDIFKVEGDGTETEGEKTERSCGNGGSCGNGS